MLLESTPTRSGLLNSEGGFPPPRQRPPLPGGRRHYGALLALAVSGVDSGTRQHETRRS